MFRTRPVSLINALILSSAAVAFAQSPEPDSSQPITLTASAASASAGKSVTFHAKVAAAKRGSASQRSEAVSNRVTFFDRATILGAAALNRQGEASFSTAWLAAGRHSVYAIAPGGARSPATDITIEPVVSNRFGPAKHFSAGLTPKAMAIADFFGNGNLDIALAGVSGIRVLPGYGDGDFGPTVPTATAFQPTAIAAGDFDGDGAMDLAATDGTTGKIYFFRGTGDGTFSAPRGIATATNPVALAIGDFNGDGIADLAVADQVGNTVLILLGHGDGTFAAPVKIQAGVAPAALAVGDFNSDGVADLAVANFGSNDVTVLLGKGDGTFPSSASRRVGNGPSTILMSDLNGDGIEDLAVLNRLDSTATVFYGKGDGTFQSAINLPAGSAPVGIAAGDPDKNGFRALLVADRSKLRWQQLSPSGSWPVIELDGGAEATAIAVADFKGDGRSGAVIGGQDGAVLHPRDAGTAWYFIFNGCPSTTPPGQSFSCTVGAYDNFGSPATGFTDHVHFTSSDGAAVLPPDTLLPNPTSFNFTLNTLGAQTLSADDPDTGLRWATIPVNITVQSAAPTHFSVSASSPVTAGSASSVTVTALDGSGNTVTGYTGAVQITSSDPQAGLPLSSTLNSGVGTFSVTLGTAGNQTITATDTVTSSITGTASVTVNAGRATNIFATGGTPQTAAVGAAFGTALQVTVVDQYNNPVSGATVTFGAPVGGASANLTGSPASTNSLGIASVTAAANHSAGVYGVTASVSGIEGAPRFLLTNTPGPATRFIVRGLDGITAGFTFTITVSALDQYGNTATGYTGTVQITSADVQASLPSNSTLNNGVGTFQVTLRTAGNQTVTATDVNTSISGTSGPIMVHAGPPAIIHTAGTPQSAVVGTAFPAPMQITMLDIFNNPVSGLQVMFEVPPAGASALLSSPTAVTNASGMASITATANVVPGSYTVIPVFKALKRGRVIHPRGGTPSASFSLTNLPNVTVQTSPAGMAFSVDGVSYTGSQSFGFAPNSNHTVAVTGTQHGALGVQYIFSNWSDNGAASHSIIATGTPATYTVAFITQYQLTTSASPAAGGTVLPASGNFYNAGATVPLVAARNAGYRFDHWSGAAAEPNNAATSIVMNGPQSCTATFTLVNGQVSPGALNLQYNPGADPSTATGSLSVTTGDNSAFTVVAADAWLTVSSSSMTTPATVTVKPNVSAMKPGTYYSSLTFSFSDGGTRVIPVTLTVLGVPQLLWTQNGSGSLDFTMPAGSTALQSSDIVVSSSIHSVPVQVTASTSSPAGVYWLSISRYGNIGATPQALHVRVDPSGLPAGVYQGTITATSTGAGISPLAIPVTLTISALPPDISVASLQNAASFSADSEAPNTILTAFGVYPGCTSAAQVAVDGSPTDVFYSSPTQVNFLLPARVSGKQSASVQIQCGGLKSPMLKVPVLNLAPGIFTVNQTGSGQAAIVNQDGSLGTATRAGTYIQVYGTGFGMFKPAGPDGLCWLELTVTATVGGMPAKVLYAGETPGSTRGLQQINVLIPADAPRGAAVPLQLTVGGVKTPPGVTLSIQ